MNNSQYIPDMEQRAGGTSINELRNRSRGGPTDAVMGTYDQYQQYQNMDQGQIYQQMPNQMYMGQHPGQMSRSQYDVADDIEDLVRDINDNLPEDISMGTEPQKEEAKESNSISKKIPDDLVDAVLLLVVFVVLSQGKVKEFIGNYVPQINPDADGKVAMTGVVVYGVILVAVYKLVRYYLV